MSQGLSLAPTRPRSCELSPGHALGPSARCAGVCPCPLSRGSAILTRPGSGIVAATASRCHVSKTIATRPSPERDGGDDISPIAKVKNKKRTSGQLFFLKIRNSSRRFEAGVILLQQLAFDSAKAIGGCNR